MPLKLTQDSGCFYKMATVGSRGKHKMADIAGGARANNKISGNEVAYRIIE